VRRRFLELPWRNRREGTGYRVQRKKFTVDGLQFIEGRKGSEWKSDACKLITEN
jgi:hypothetical protein